LQKETILRAKNLPQRLIEENILNRNVEETRPNKSLGFLCPTPSSRKRKKRAQAPPQRLEVKDQINTNI